MSPTLNRAALPGLPAACRPLVDPAELRPRIVHFGLGAFHRAHQAVYTEAAAARSGEPWGIVAVGPRSSTPIEAARAQDCLFSVTDRVPGAGRTRVVGSVVDALRMGPDAERIDALLSSPEVTAVTLTVTEKGYSRHPGTGALDTADPGIAADLGATASPEPVPMRTVVGRLTASLAARFRRCGAPITVVSCDNAAANGTALAAVVRGFAESAAWPDRDRLLDWLRESVAFPDSVVDRIVPATTDADRDRASRALGVRDGSAVLGEPFRQWVVQDAFAADRPPWELDGALLVPDVAPHQMMKLRLLNGAHSALAYLGLATGCATVAEAMRAEWGERLVRRFTGEVAATLPAGLDVAGYVEDLVARFGNPAIAHRLQQIGSDGSRKVPERWLGGLRELRARGTGAPVLELALGAWADATRPGERGGQAFGTADPAEAALAECWDGAAGLPVVVARLLSVLGAPDLAEDDELVRSVAARMPDLRAGRIDL